jgi:hypothetical protein
MARSSCYEPFHLALWSSRNSSSNPRMRTSLGVPWLSKVHYFRRKILEDRGSRPPIR